MYHEFYNLNCMPFENAPQSRFFYESEQHREALASIEYALRMGKGYVMITGEVGSGKTTVAAQVKQHCKGQATMLTLMHGHQSADELLRQILRSLNVRIGRRDDHARLTERLGNYLHAEARNPKPLVIFVDEAQTLSDEALEELRLLSNYDPSIYKPIQVVLCGHPELRTRICSPRFDALRQRIVLAKQLEAFSQEDTKEYIAHRLAAASNDPQQVAVTFDDSAVRAIHQLSGGLPRLINVTCDNCLLLGFVQETTVMTAAMVRRVAQDMMPSFHDESSADRLPVSQQQQQQRHRSTPSMPNRLSLTGTM